MKNPNNYYRLVFSGFRFPQFLSIHASKIFTLFFTVFLIEGLVHGQTDFCDENFTEEILESSIVLSCQDPLCDQYGHAQADLILTNESASSLGFSYVGQTIEIEGTFTVDINYKFKDCILRMNPDAAIFVNVSKTFELENCKVFSCKEMWEGIIVNGGGIKVTNSEIEDAWYAIDINAGISCWITDTKFNKCDVCIYLQNWYAPKILIAGNEFNCNPSLYENSPHYPVIAKRPYVGIWIENSSGVFIGNSSFSNNQLLWHGVQMIVNNSQVTVWRSRFYGYGYLPLSGGGPEFGTGIYASNDSYVRVIGLGNSPTDEPTFGQYWIASIRSDNSTIECVNSLFDEFTFRAVWIENTGNHYWTIQGNTFLGNSSFFDTRNIIQARRGGILKDRIWNNYFDIDYPLANIGAVIRILDNNNSSNQAHLYGNTIWFEGPAGIDVPSGNSKNNRIDFNKIYLNADADVGINMALPQGSTPGADNFIGFNTIEQGDFTLDVGINVNATTNAVICGNRLIETEVGINLSGNCMNTEIGSNEFHDNSIGLRLQANGVNLGVGTNDHKANEWYGTFSTRSAQHTGNDFQFSPFKVNDDTNTECGHDEYFPNSNGVASVTPVNNWFFPEDGCQNWCQNLSLIPGEDNDGLDELDTAIITGQYVYTGQSDASVWDAGYSEYRKIKKSEDFYEDSPMALDYIDDLAESNIALLYEFEQLITEAFHYADSTRDSLEYYSLLIDSLMANLPAVHEAYLADTSDTDLKSQLEEGASLLEDSKQSLEQCHSESEQEKTGKLAAATAVNDEIAPANVFEAYQKRVNNFRLKYYSGIVLSEYDLDTLSMIASMCYEDAGPAIYFAYSLLPDCMQPEVFPNTTCQEKKFASELSFPNKHKVPRLYPNPTSGLLYLGGMEAFEKQSFTGTICDAYGRVVRQVPVITDMSLEVQSLGQGFYMLKISDGQNNVATLRFLKISR